MSSDEIVFLCDQCDDIFLTKSAINEHHKANHEASIYDVYEEAERKPRRKFGPASRVKRVRGSENEEGAEDDLQQAGTAKPKRKMGPASRVKRNRSSSNEAEVEDGHVVKIGQNSCSERNRFSHPQLPPTLKGSDIRVIGPCSSLMLNLDKLKSVEGKTDIEMKLEKNDNKVEGSKSPGKDIGEGKGSTLNDSNRDKCESGKDGYSYKFGDSFEKAREEAALERFQKKCNEVKGRQGELVKTGCSDPIDLYPNEKKSQTTMRNQGSILSDLDKTKNKADPVSSKPETVALKQTSTSQGIVRGHDNISGPECFKCRQVCKDNTNLKNHVLSHYYKVFYDVLPDSKPYACPICNHPSRDRITMVRHYAFTHKKLYELTDVIPENLVGSQDRVTIPGTRQSGKSPAKEKHTDADGRLFDINTDDEDIKVQRITDMVVERLQKNVREVSGKTCETPEEKDNEHDKDKESDVVKPRKKDGMVKYGDGVNNNGRKAPISNNDKKISLPDSPMCEPDKTKKDKHRHEEEKKRSRVKIDPRSQIMKKYGLGSSPSEQERKDREEKYRNRIKTPKDVIHPKLMKEHSSDPSFSEPVKPLVVGSSGSGGKTVIQDEPKKNNHKEVKNNHEEIRCDESVLEEASTSTVGIKRARKDQFGNTSIYSDNVLAKFFNPQNPSNDGLSSFKIPKLAPVCSLQEDKKGINDQSTSHSSKEKQMKARRSLTDQNVMVDGKSMTLGTYLEEVGISPKVDASKLMMQNGEAQIDNVDDVRKVNTMDKEELEDIHNNNWDMKKINSDEERVKLSRRCFKNPVPANPGNNLTFHGYRGRGKYRANISAGSVIIKQGVLEPVPGYKRKNREDVVVNTDEKKKMEYDSFGCFMKNLYFKKYEGQMSGEKISQKQFQEFQFFMKHVKAGQEETKNFLSFYSNKAVTLKEVQVDEVRDIESIMSRYRRFYGQPDPAKCDRCNTFHLFSQHY